MQGVVMVLAGYGCPLMVVSSFKYLGRVLSASDNNWTAVICNLRRARHKWARLLWMLVHKGGGCADVGNFLHRNVSGGAPI